MMSNFLLSIMKGRRKGIGAQLIVLALWPCTWAYALGLFCHRAFFRMKGAYKAPRPVVSIGNITVGGAGKTPLVIWLARRLQDAGLKSIILIRGYMPQARQVSDEVDMINEQIPYIPVLAGSDRIANIRESEEVLPVDLYICDDAFQHWALRRDVDIVVVDTNNPFGNGHLLPAGILREPLGALRRAHIVVLTKVSGTTDLGALRARLKKINPRALFVESSYRSSGVEDVFNPQPVGEGFLKGKTVAAFCAIGDPLSFEAGLNNSGARILKLWVYRDHHVYQKDDLEAMIGFCRKQNIEILVTTHKDAVKLKTFKGLFEGLRLLYVPIQVEITEGCDEFCQRIISVCRR